MSHAEAAEVVWRPSPERVACARVTHFTEWLRVHKGLHFADYPVLWQWSVDELKAFWWALVEYFELPLEGQRTPVLVA
ncbi:MAG: hypothetical protein ABI574_02275 [Burkholderiales bacterium]